MDSTILIIIWNVVLVLAVIGLLAVSWSRQDRVRQVKLGELASVIGGTQVKRSIIGTWNGVSAKASIQSESDGEAVAFYWQTELAVQLGATFTLGAESTGLLRRKIGPVKLHCYDQGYKRALIAAGLVEMATAHSLLSQPEVKVSYAKGLLALRQPIRNQTALPDPADFQALLELLLAIASYHERAILAAEPHG